uniref:DNA binding domain-containing protein, excisionase family n=1 Tax=Candidatus Kentrum sp. SD TaxID=2126332 RepID=A0A450YUS3_9GAMM|nr:MAG: hypothetical protein BECKSD772F_GA0070984_12182 [Candidatus Kentron sp. SD]
MSHFTDEEEYISVQETALLLGCCDASVKGALRKGTISGKKVKKHVDVWMVSKASALEYKKNQAKIKGKDDFQTNHKEISIKDASKILGIPRLDFLKLIESGKLKTEGLGYHRVIKK